MFTVNQRLRYKIYKPYLLEQFSAGKEQELVKKD